MGPRHLLTSIALAATLAQAKPGTVEIDLIFPRNETYKPDLVFPIVFSFRDANNASAHLNGFTISWVLSPYKATFESTNSSGGGEAPTSYSTGAITIPPGGQNTPQYLWDTIEWPTSNATKWWLTWIPLANCTGEGSDGQDAMDAERTVLEFTTDEHGSSYEIVPKDCKSPQSYVMNITAQSGSEAAHGSADPYCGYGDGPLPEANPCGDKISASEAKKIVDAARSKACHANNPAVSCNSNSGAAVLAINGVLILAVAAAGALLIAA